MYHLLTTDFTARNWPGLGSRTALHFTDLLTDNTETIGPLSTRQEAMRAIEQYAESHTAFNVHCYGKLVGTTEY